MSKKYQERDDTNRSHKITVRLSDDEYEQINVICEVLGLTYSQFLRRAALTVRFGQPIIQRSLDTETSQTLAWQFSRIGNNLNQIARKLNSGEKKENELLTQIGDRLSDLHQYLLHLKGMETDIGDSEAP